MAHPRPLALIGSLASRKPATKHDLEEKEEKKTKLAKVEKESSTPPPAGPPASGPVYLVTKVDSCDSMQTVTYRIPATVVSPKLKDALHMHQGRMCNPDDDDAEFRKACKLIDYKLEQFGACMLVSDEPHKGAGNAIVDSYLFYGPDE